MKDWKITKCNICPLYESPHVMGEINCSFDDVDLMVLAEAPAKDEIDQGRPLIGKAGQIFRIEFKESGLENFNHFISNVVICSNIIDGRTVNPPKEAIENCKPMWQRFIRIFEPKLIMIMGSIPMKAFEIADSGITKLRGNIFSYGDIPVLLTLHPSYIARGHVKPEEKEGFKSDFRLARKLLEQLNE